jgi:hypothetical protein
MNILDQFLISGAQTQTATTTSTAYALTPGTCVLVTNEATTGVVRVAFGGPLVAATAASCSIPPLNARTFSVRDGSTYIAVKTDTATNSVNVATGEGSSTT